MKQLVPLELSQIQPLSFIELVLELEELSLAQVQVLEPAPSSLS